MAEPLKNRYDQQFFQSLIADIRAVHPPFDASAFLSCLFDDEWEEKELKARLHHITDCLHSSLALPYDQALAILRPVAAKQAPSFEHMFFPDYVERYGLAEDWNLNMEALAHFTRYSSSEFAIRPFILQDPERAMAQLLRWARDPNEHVRRLASEGCRPRLPWAMALPAFKVDPGPIFPILTQMRQDPVAYVHRSVANNLNDIAKDHPEQVIAWARRWQGSHPITDWVIRHGARSMLKRGYPDALALFGLGPIKSLALSDLLLAPTSPAIGEVMRFSFQLRYQAEQARTVRIEYAIDFVKANGKWSRKVFHLAEQKLAPNQLHAFTKSHAFRQLTTRKHYPGEHQLAILVNGLEQVKCAFTLRP